MKTRNSMARSYRARRIHRDNSRIKKLAVLLAMPTVSVVALAAASSMLSVPKMDEDFCYDALPQDKVLMFIESSFTAEMSAPQKRDVRNMMLNSIGAAKANTLVSVVTTTTDENGSVPVAQFSMCIPATMPEEQKSIGAPNKTQAQLNLLSEKARDALEAGFDSVLADVSDSARNAGDSPILEQLQGISRMREFQGRHRVLVAVTDGLQNSATARFCTVKGDLPPFSIFKDREKYEAVEPNGFDGVDVKLGLVEQGSFPQPGFQFCSNAEIRKFWKDYFEQNGAESVEVTNLRLWAGQD